MNKKSALLVGLLLVLGVVAYLGFGDKDAKFRIDLRRKAVAAAGQALGATGPQAVYLSSSEGGERKFGLFYPLDCTNPKRYRFAGFVVQGAREGETVTAADSGVVDGFKNLKPGTIYYASASAPGAISETPPDLPGYFRVPLGIAVSPTSLEVTPALAATATPIEAPKAGNESVASDDSLAPARTAEDLVKERGYECSIGRTPACLFLAALGRSPRTAEAIRPILEKRCFGHTDLDDCYQLGRFGLPQGEAAQGSRLKEESDACLTGKTEHCAVASSILAAQNRKAEELQLLRSACDRGLWESCFDLGERLPDSEARQVRERCAHGNSAKDCVIAGGRGSKDAMEKACKLGEPWGCLLEGSELDSSPSEVAAYEKSCAAGQSEACLQLAGYRFGRVYDYAAAAKLLDGECQRGVQAACKYKENRAGALTGSNR